MFREDSTVVLHVSELSSCPLVQSTWPSHLHDHGIHGWADPQLKWSARHSMLPTDTSYNCHCDSDMYWHSAAL